MGWNAVVEGEGDAWSTKSSAGRCEYSYARSIAVLKASTTFVPSEAEQYKNSILCFFGKANSFEVTYRYGVGEDGAGRVRAGRGDGWGCGL